MRYSSYLLLTSALDGYEWSASRPTALYPRETTPILIGQESGWTLQLVWTQTRGKILRPARDRTSFIQSLVTYYSDWATAAFSCYIPATKTDAPRFSLTIRLCTRGKRTPPPLRGQTLVAATSKVCPDKVAVMLIHCTTDLIHLKMMGWTPCRSVPLLLLQLRFYQMFPLCQGKELGRFLLFVCVLNSQYDIMN
jgi:hypothetical protein